MKIQFTRECFSDLEEVRRKEWLETNGLGGFASSTIAGMNTRRYHGLLIAATRPPTGRVVLLSKLEETLLLDDRPHGLSTNQYPRAIHPQGYKVQTGFRLDPFPVFSYEVEALTLEKRVFMVHGENTTVVRYRLLGAPAANARLEVDPLIAFRDYHSLTHRNDALDGTLHYSPGCISIAPYSGLPTLYIHYSPAEILNNPDWFLHFEYEEERRRGLDYEEDLFRPCALRFDLSQGAADIIVSTEQRDIAEAPKLQSEEEHRRKALLQGWEPEGTIVEDLLGAADQFLVRRDRDLASIIAGYHWFTDWGRDAMISLPGLILAPGHHREARRILQTFALHCDRGMLPNRFPDQGEQPEYNSIDSALWFVQAVYAYAQATEDYAYVQKSLQKTLLEILHWHIEGTRFNIKVDTDGLLGWDAPGMQLTWMDAKIGDRVITPRNGKPVEIQALWYNALRVVEFFAKKFGDLETAQRCTKLAIKTRLNFNRLFWNLQKNCLYDCIHGEEMDDSMRPNQLFAISLPFAILPQSKMKRVVDTVTRELLTPFGLRSLAPGDPRYHPTYEGGVVQRDEAYHQGTVWAWLMGPYLTARLRAYRNTKRARQEALALLAGMRENLTEAGLGSVSELFDGDAPHLPRGCIAQAWSVAELLRVAIVDLDLSIRENA